MRLKFSVHWRWPTVRNGVGLSVNGIVKRTSIQEVLDLAAEAAASGFSAQARPAWLRENSDQIKDLFVTILAVNSDGYIRCSVVAILSDGSGGHFPLDIKPSRFEKMKAVGYEGIVDLAHRYLNYFKSIPLDPGQQVEWDRHYGPRKLSIVI